jgi:hypothetical protein
LKTLIDINARLRRIETSLNLAEVPKEQPNGLRGYLLLDEAESRS